VALGSTRSGRGIRLLIVIGVGIAAAVLVGTTGVTVVRIEDDEEVAQAGAFDAPTYVDGIWPDVVSTIEDEAVDLAVVLNAIEPDDDGMAPKDQLVAVAEEHGLITAGEAHVYKVEAVGTVAEVDTSSSTGTLRLQLDGYDGPIAVDVYIGPRIPSDDSSVRDAMEFISFGDFRDQTEYGRVAAEINARVRDEVMSSLEPETLIDQRVTVHGALTIRTFNLLSIDVSHVNVVPVSIEVE
jgi:predicted lipoprotein